MGNVDKLSMKLMLTVLTNPMPDVYVWTYTIWMTSFAVSHKWSRNSEQVFINQRNFRPTSIGKHNSMGHLLPCAIDFTTNHPPIHLQWIGKLGIATEPRHVIGASPTGSHRWSHCLQRHLACEGLYIETKIISYIYCNFHYTKEVLLCFTVIYFF